MKVIDLLNKIANGEEVPKLIKWDGTTWYFNEDLKNYSIVQDYDEYEHLLDYLLDYQITKYLNDEIEIIEEPKKIEKLIRYAIDYEDGGLREDELKEYIKDISDKLDEIIDYINSKEN